MKKTRLIGPAILILLILGAFFNQIVSIIINIKWFNEVGYLSVYLTKITATLKLMVPIFLICFLSIWIYFKSIKKSIVKLSTVVEVDTERERKQRKIFMWLNAAFSLLISFIFSASYWYRILQFSNATSFKINDPIFNIDISFFVFRLPLIESLYSIFIALLILLGFVTVVIYLVLTARDRVVFGAENFQGRSTISSLKSGITKFAGKQLAVLGALILAFISIGYVIKALNLVYSPRGVVFGASYTDTKLTLKFYLLIVIVSLISSIVVFISILKSKIKPIVLSVILIAFLIVSEGIVSGMWQKFIVKSNEKGLEAPFIRYNMEYTKKAFSIDDIEEKSYPLTNNLTKAVIDRNRATVDNIKVNSVTQALEFYNQVESKKNYYVFNDIDIGRYNVNGKYTQVFIAPREIQYDKLLDKASTWQNKHLTYTHGYGVVMSKVNSVTSEGKPDILIKDMPLSNKSDIKIDDPRIYFGEKTDIYAIVNTKINEMDYPKESGNDVTTNYNGKAGIKMSFINRLLFAISEKDIKFLLSGDINGESKILINRNIVDRVKKIAPFLVYDNDPYIVVKDGKLYWIIDAYTVSNRYPFSQPVNDINYIRNSVKVIIDAVNGTTDFYIVDENDPIVNSYSNIFPELFKSIKELPNGFREHFRYPEDYFLVQCSVLEKYHVNSENEFYSGQNVWDISKSQKQVDGQDTINNASYTIMKLPGETKEELILLEYFNQNQRENMVALLGARMDGNNYGKLVLYKFPTTESETVNSPILFKQKINQDTAISKELSLWDAKGSQVQFGDTMIIPIENSLLYIEPLYLRANGEKSIPEMKRVIASYGDKMILAQNVDEALKILFNTEVKNEENNSINNDVSTSNISNYIKEAKDLYNKAIEAQKSGNWAQYGEYINKLGEVLSKVSK
ncbi:hypothetical protein CLHOM_21470 [Clostridium homopropionicum DSM 5847]|uniref:UPF0182 protein CLHOM_21470 n=1 Tax=Clostridium homopropionicum DSM 5847 TaxID=1121318 RepID=A0A0L6Z981_9CLOT|nr:UPF0182 family protein [Clostridium homopropionicum]KOA19532.1 hypothetical protein CLHOM_21470 [Clostridium homopropionicum DSM 5847]SFG93025.1 hypothetical protein SAMN04488501_12438 [Clostridium homopropionicum]